MEPTENSEVGLWTASQRRLLATAVLIFAAGLWLTSRPAADARKPLSAPAFRVDPNTAPLQMLVTLPGIGPGRAKAIIAERANGPYRSLSDLEQRVPGIGPVMAEGMAAYLVFEPPAQ